MTITQSDPRPLVSVVIPAYNESAVITSNLQAVCEYLDSLQDRYRWELIVVNDGSTDSTGDLADAFAQTHENVLILHHRRNFGLGQAFQFAFSQCRGDYVVTLDLDLSYSPDHLEQLLERIQKTGAKVVAASPYMKGGQITRVPWFRRTLSVVANRFLSLAAKADLSTLTSMVRVYDARFLRKLSLRSMGMEINPELIQKAMLLRGQIDEIPAHLDWSLQRSQARARRSSMRFVRQMMSVLLSGFLFRPVMFFIVPGVLLAVVATYASAWVLSHVGSYYIELSDLAWFPDRLSEATAAAFELSPHSFIIAGMTWMLSIQLVGLGILALQSQSYFEELFHLGSYALDHDRSEARSRRRESPD